MHIVLAALLNLALASGAQAEGPIRCFDFQLENPSRDPHDAMREERWCYQEVTLSSGEGLYIFNGDSEEVRPELALVKNPDGSLTHGSLLAGEISFHRVDGREFNPFPVPLRMPTEGGIQPPISLLATAQVVLAELTRANPPLADLKVSEGPQAAQARQPWRGYWWPYKNFPMGSVLMKYDRFVQARTGSNPGTYSWERSRHVYKGVWWEGHCNGWVASAILRSQPTTARTDGRSGAAFSVSDLKGVLAEHDYCARATLYGRRYRNGGDLYDMNPALFHRTIQYYIGNLGKPIGIDYRRDVPVDNHIASGYSMRIVRTSPTTLNVTTNLRVHRYDTKRTNVPGIAPAYTRVYKYVLTQDGNGNTTGGRWLSTNPDFLWAALGSANCRRGGKELREEYVRGILGL